MTYCTYQSVHWLSYSFSWVLDVAIKCLNVERHSWDICQSLLPYDCVDALFSFIGETVNFLEDCHIASCLKISKRIINAMCLLPCKESEQVDIQGNPPSSILLRIGQILLKHKWWTTHSC